tara:strand:- start:695 stop:1051 length:357 start_codon:yes stop_codon:yes gene_type:complete
MKQRTTQQNKALHKWFELISDDMNNAGYTVLKTLRKDVELDWNAILFKELIWRPIQKSLTKKTSSADLESGELQIIWDTINRHLGEKFGIHTPFPTLDVMIEQLGKVDYPDHDEEPEF